ncbi:PREDICTED: fatty-acid amide hydrolase 1-like [Nanorana parkeri]|uniref:fatty-acid amide hydrolase 1-like n=1 Tax=Nanorana parkeri TaxID=125878 RepID=UPI000854C33A|nr:PREDICTED: fatty-acid amide hydrolase 1-like [Nanorana parkeri]
MFLPSIIFMKLSDFVPDHMTSCLPVAISYTVLYNLLDFPVGVLPVTAVTREDEEALRSYEGHHRDLWDKLLKEALADGVGLPVAVQCVTLPWQEERCLRLMKEVESVTGRWSQ